MAVWPAFLPLVRVLLQLEPFLRGLPCHAEASAGGLFLHSVRAHFVEKRGSVPSEGLDYQHRVHVRTVAIQRDLDGHRIDYFGLSGRNLVGDAAVVFRGVPVVKFPFQ